MQAISKLFYEGEAYESNNEETDKEAEKLRQKRERLQTNYNTLIEERNELNACSSSLGEDVKDLQTANETMKVQLQGAVKGSLEAFGLYTKKLEKVIK